MFFQASPERRFEQLCALIEAGRAGLEEVNELNRYLAATQATIPPAVEAGALRITLAERPDDGALLCRLCEVTVQLGEEVAPELEARACAAALNARYTEPALLGRLCRHLHLTGANVVRRLADAGFPTATEYPALNARPLFFVHVPRTAGGSVSAFLDSQFDEADVCPAWNPPDLVALGDRAGRYRLFRGHFTAEHARIAGDGAELFTILRAPVAQAYSMYAWRRRLDHTYWKEAESAARALGASLAGGLAVALDRRASEYSMRLARILSFRRFLSSDDRVARACTGDVAAGFLSDAGSSAGPRHRMALAASARRNLRRCLTVGVHEHLWKSMLALCWRRGWAAPASLPRIHSNRDREAFRAVDGRTRALIMRKARLDVSLYAAAQARLARDWAQLTAAAGSADGVADFLDSEHRRRFFESAPAVHAVDMGADRAWPGAGWGPRERNEHGQVWRWMGESVRASLLFRLVPGPDYLLSATLHTAASAELFEGLRASVAGTSLQPAGRGESGGHLVVHWLIGSDLVRRQDGRVEIVFESDNRAAGSRAIAFSRLVCQPW